MINRNFINLVTAGAAFGIAALSAGTASAVTASAPARARILQPITVTNTADLNFGTIVVGATGGNATVTTAGLGSCNGGLACSGTMTAAAFDVTGTANEAILINVPATVTLNGNLGGSMTATLSSPTTGLLDGTGATSFAVGGSLAVANAQTAGVYSGSVSVDVIYQ